MSMSEAEYARKRAEARQQSSWFKLKEGDNTFRILPTPPTKTVSTNFYEYAIHRDVGPKKQVVRCGVDVVKGDGECWLCDVKIPSLKKAGKNARAALLAPKANLLVQVAKVDDAGKFSGPYLFTPAKTIGDQLLASIFGSRKRSYVDAAKGYNISITRTGTGKNDTRYGILEPDQEPSKVPASIIDKLKPFEELKEVPLYSQAKQQAAYTGQDIADDDGEEEERPKSKTRKPVVDDSEEEEEELEEEESEEDDDEEEAEDEPAPKAKSKVAAKKAVGKKQKPADDEEEEEESEDEESEDEDDIDLEDEEEDEEDDEPPAKKGKAKPVAKSKKKATAEEKEEDEDEEADDEEDEPAPKAKSKVKSKPAVKAKSKKAVEPEDEDEELDLDDIPDEIDDEEDEPAPKAKAKSKVKVKGKAKPEPEEEDEEADDEDEDEAPPKKAVKKAGPKPRHK